MDDSRRNSWTWEQKRFTMCYCLCLYFFEVSLSKEQKQVDQKEMLPKIKYSHRLLAAIICENTQLSIHQNLKSPTRKKFAVKGIPKGNRLRCLIWMNSKLRLRDRKMLCRQGHAVWKLFPFLLFSFHAVILLSSGESMSADEIEAARVRNAASMSTSRKHNHFVALFKVSMPSFCYHQARVCQRMKSRLREWRILRQSQLLVSIIISLPYCSVSMPSKHNHFVALLFSFHAVILLLSGESMSADEIEAARVRNAASMSTSRKHNHFAE